MNLVNFKDQWLRGNIWTSNLISLTSCREYAPKINCGKKSYITSRKSERFEIRLAWILQQ